MPSISTAGEQTGYYKYILQASGDTNYDLGVANFSQPIRQGSNLLVIYIDIAAV